MFFPDYNLSKLEKQLFKDMETILEARGFEYLSVPSTITKDTYTRQEIHVPFEKILKLDEEHPLAGSAEQGILEHFKGHCLLQQQVYSKNQCFRYEEKYEGMKYLREFTKMEQFVFLSPHSDKNYWFDELLNNATDLLDKYNIKYRTVDKTKEDPGYHIKKVDIEVQTKTYGWLETHSCTYFGEEQTRRFGITGATHTISNTALASPRILVPFIENDDIMRYIEDKDDR